MNRRDVLKASLAAALTSIAAACGTETVVADDPVGAMGTSSKSRPTTTRPTVTSTSAPATTAAPSTTTATSSTTTTLPPTTTLPTPDPVPADPYAPEPEVVLGTVTIPRLGLETELREGVTLTTIDRGPGHWPGSAMPGQAGNCVIAGHRVTHSKPFRHIDDMVIGDEMVVRLNDGSAHIYETTGSQVVDDQDIWIIEPTSDPTATLFACHPPGSARQRYVVRLALKLDGAQLPG